MNSKYDQIMEHVSLTPEMRRRVLQHLQEEPLPSRTHLLRHRLLRQKLFQRCLSAAACLVLLLTGAAVLPRLLGQAQPDPPIVQGTYNIEEASSIQELAELVGFEITEDFRLPFAPSETIYTSYWRELADIRYSGEGQQAVFRKSVGTADNSGDFTAYSLSSEITLNSCSVLLKGSGSTYSLAVWTDGEYAYSLYLSKAAAEEDWREILAP